MAPGNRRTGPTRARGLTLVEVLVVLALIGVLAGMTVPRLAGATSGRQLRQDAQRLLLSARAARDHAVLHRRLCRLMIDERSGRFAVVARESDGQTQNFRPLAFGIGRTQRLGPGVRFQQVRIEPMPRADFLGDELGITFDELGQADAAIVVLADASGCWSLRTAPSTGRVRLDAGQIDELLMDRLDLDDQ